MGRFNPLNYPICFSQPQRIATSAWLGHLPFALSLIDILRPRTVVELGTFTGVSYCAFCQAIKELKATARCFAIDTWRGDEQTGFYGEDVLADLKSFHDEHYSDFSALIQSTFDSALLQFADSSVDLLHIDGLHRYEQVKHDFESWLPKMSERGIVLLHDICERQSDFGVWQLWDELELRYPTFEFHHAHGLGVVATTQAATEPLRDLFAASENDSAAIRSFFESLGERLTERTDDDERSSRLRDCEKEIAARDRIIDEISAKFLQVNSQNVRIVNSRAWRWVNHYGRLKNKLFRAAVKQTSNHDGAATSVYADWVKKYDSLNDEDRLLISSKGARLSYKPLISIVVQLSAVAENTSSTIQSIRRQLYENWELYVIADRDVDLTAISFDEDSRIKLIVCEPDEYLGSATNRVIINAGGDFIGFVCAGARLAEHALYTIVRELNIFTGYDLMYTDEDTIDHTGQRSNPHFKPDWNPDLFCSGNYISQFTLYRSSLVKHLGGLRSGYEGSEQYDLALRVSEHIPRYRIRHIPHVLYHRGESRDQPSNESARRAISDHFTRLSIAASVTNVTPGNFRVQYALPSPLPLTTLIVATRDRVDLLRQIVDGVLNQTDYSPLELLIVDNQSVEAETLEYLETTKTYPQVSVLTYDQPFNFSAINNFGARLARGSVIGFLNNDLKVISPGWLREMVSHAVRPEVGVVGAKLYYPDDSIQHAGVIVGLGGLAGYVHRRAPRAAEGHALRLQQIQNYSALTAACMLMRRSVFQEVGGFDEINLPVAYNDVDLCLRIREKGYRILWTPYAELYHLESASRASDWSAEERSRYERECAYLKSRWGSQIAHDPSYNPNLTIGAEDFSLAYPPRTIRPWE
jgi:GT2 family glycosyltransferase